MELKYTCVGAGPPVMAVTLRPPVCTLRMEVRPCQVGLGEL